MPIGLNGVKSIAAGGFHSLALKDNGMVVAWGDDSYGQTNVPIGLNNVMAVAGGGDHSLALKTNGTVVAWGYNGAGQTTVPAGLVNVVAIAAGEDHSLALKADGRVVAWGWNGSGQTFVPAGSNYVNIAADWEHSLALKNNGTVVSWGDEQTNVPAGLSNVVAIAAGFLHSLALKADGTVVAWGENSSGQTNVPPGLSNVVAIAGGGYHSLALQANGTVVAWGDDGWGQPTVPIGLSNVVAVAAGVWHGLVIQNDGSPVIVRQSSSQIVSNNSTVAFTVTALGQPSLGYQWQKNGANLTDGGNVSGSTTATLTLSNVQSADVASYTLVITNAIDQVTSVPATLAIFAVAPTITAQPLSQTVVVGSHLQFSVAASGYPSLSYQWRQNGTNPVGSNSPVLVMNNVNRAQSGSYSVVVTNSNGQVFSSNAVLRVTVPQRLGMPKLSPGGSFQLTSGNVDGVQMTAADLANLDVQVSANLVDWVTLPAGLSLTNGTLQLQDNDRTNSPSRFYRIVEH